LRICGLVKDDGVPNLSARVDCGKAVLFEGILETGLDFAGVLFVTNLAPRQNLLLFSCSSKGAADPLSADDPCPVLHSRRTPAKIKFPIIFWTCPMETKFEKRFNINVDLTDARKRFVNRVYNEIFQSLFDKINAWDETLEHTKQITISVCTALGVQYSWREPISQLVGQDFHDILKAIEAMAQNNDLKGFHIESIVQDILNHSEIDLGVRWHEGKFLPSGSALLDERLVNDVLGLLARDNHETVLQPFNKGLDHLLRATNKPELLSDVITDMYEALEAMAMIVTGNTRELSANRELFISKLNLSEYFKKLLKDYIEYANDLGRHAGNPGEGKPIPEYKEVESFVYLTGLFIRLAVQ